MASTRALFPVSQWLGVGGVATGSGADGSVLAGLTNRGWSSLGTASYGLQRLV